MKIFGSLTRVSTIAGIILILIGIMGMTRAFINAKIHPSSNSSERKTATASASPTR